MAANWSEYDRVRWAWSDLKKYGMVKPYMYDICDYDDQHVMDDSIEIEERDVRKVNIRDKSSSMISQNKYLSIPSLLLGLTFWIILIGLWEIQNIFVNWRVHSHSAVLNFGTTQRVEEWASSADEIEMGQFFHAWVTFLSILLWFEFSIFFPIELEKTMTFNICTIRKLVKPNYFAH